MTTFFGIKNGQEALFASRHWRDGKKRLLVFPDERTMSVAEASFEFFVPDMPRTVFPSWDCLPYDRLPPKTDIMGRRLEALRRMREVQGGLLVLCTSAALLQRVSLKHPGDLILVKNKTVSLAALPATLAALGFARTMTVREPGEFAVRGDLLDIFPPQHERPIRVTFFGDEIERLDHFDPLSQLRQEEAGNITLQAANEVLLDEEAVINFREGYRGQFGTAAAEDPLYESVSQARAYGGMEHYLPLFDKNLTTLTALAEDIVFTDGAQAAMQERREHVQDLYQARLSFMQAEAGQKKKAAMRSAVIRPLRPECLYLTEEECKEAVKKADLLSHFSDPHKEDAVRLPDFNMARHSNMQDALHLAAVTLRDWQSKGLTTLYAAMSPSGLERAQHLLKTHGFNDNQFKICATIDEARNLKADRLGLVQLPLPHGFADERFALLTEGDVFGDRLQQKPVRKRASDTFFKEFSSLQPGDLVVHREHGIGRFDGLEAVLALGVPHDCLRIVYEGGDKLFVPVEGMDVLSRYGEDEGNVALDKMGSTSWQSRKARVRKNVLEMAGKLLEIAAERQLREAPIYDASGPNYQAFCARFPYAETEDQLRAISDVLEDFQKGRPMDRLVCGDVGFGKTEVALRAAYVAASNGDQVAVTVPTTLLARQHGEVFRERFSGFNFKIGELSRLNTSKENDEVRKELANGDIQIVIGTHALLSAKVKFAKLGLVIVDEEQRFGVKQKEKLKDLQKDVHVLTLTATPIPRTLQMALTGVRDLSLITTPPVDRLSIRSFVTPFDPVMMREALMRERYRSGQSFIVTHYISDIEEIEKRLQQLVPELSYIVAHGQLPAQALEERMMAFVEGRYDILVATAIIESGIDIPRANTIIINRSEQFGLAQLYQLRGRIGRAKQRGYAYLTYEPDTVLTEAAQKRLHVLESLDQLGGGFQLASHDMDIRGAGNLLGEAQSGHVREVGIELYQQMLEDAVAEARGGGTHIDRTEDWTPVIDLGLPVFIPETYVPDLSVRISLYRRLAGLAQQGEIDIFADELIDRFGRLPEEVRTLLDTIRIKTLCIAANIEKIEAGPKAVLITFKNNAPSDPSCVLSVIAAMGGLAKLRPDQKVQLVGALEARHARIAVIQRFCESLVSGPKSSTLVA